MIQNLDAEFARFQLHLRKIENKMDIAMIVFGVVQRRIQMNEIKNKIQRIKIEIEVTGNNPFVISDFYKLIKNYLKNRARVDGLKISIKSK